MLLPKDGGLTHPPQTWILPDCPFRSLQAPEFPLTEPSVESLLESPVVELSLNSNFPTKLSQSHRIRGNIRSTEQSSYIR
jgi:hypothetical protein